MRSTFLVVPVLLVLLASPAIARPGPWIGASGSWGTYTMSDVNDEVTAINALLAGTGLSMDEINNGFGFGGAAGIGIADRISLGFGYERLSASTDVGDASGSLEYDFPANAFRLLGQYDFPTTSTFVGHVGFGVGFVTEAGSVTVSASGVGSQSGDVSGSGGLFEGLIGGELWAAPQFAITMDGGFRYAKVSEVKVEDVVVRNADGSKYTIDYTGVLVRLGVKVALVP